MCLLVVFNPRRGRTNSVVLGASLLSAVASLPLHLLPLLVAAVSFEGRLPLAQVGWIGSAYMVGQLVAVLALPSARMTRVLNWHAVTAVVTLPAVLVFSASQQGWALLGSWLFVGTVCGILHFAAMTTAAAASDRRAAFALRMAMSSLTGGCVIAGLQLMRGVAVYSTLAMQLAVAFAIVGSVGVSFYRAPPDRGPVPPLPQSDPAAVSMPGSSARGAWLPGLLVLFVLFAGQHGLWAFAVQGARERGLTLAQVAYAIAACKLIAGCVVLLGSPRSSPDAAEARDSLLVSCLAVMAGGGGMAYARDPIVFWVAFLFWEVGFTVLSARLQAVAAQRDPRMAGMWMTSAIFLGAAAGPAVAGLVLRLDWFWVFVVFAGSSALLPHVWASRTVQPKRGAQKASVMEQP